MLLQSSDHSHHCRACKTRVRELLAATYGSCLTHHTFGWSSLPQTYRHSTVGDALLAIFQDLGRFRGYHDFIRTPRMPPCDYYIPHPGFILEFDEPQHFSKAREITLRHYTKHLPTGFSVREWMRLCQELDARDNEPPDRDERRAWYDCLRDLLPLYHGLNPTIRLYSGSFQWCALNGNSEMDLQTFESLLRRP